MKTLSDKIEIEGDGTWGCKDGWCDVEDVKQFIKDLKKELMWKPLYSKQQIEKQIDKLAGDKLK